MAWWYRSRLIAIAAGVVAVSSSFAPKPRAQTSAADDVLYHALQIVAKLEEEGAGCDLSLHGAPRHDETTDRWLVAYSGVGAACDDMGESLQRLGVPAEITFFRRPNADEVKKLASRMRASVRRGFPCLLVFNGEPQFDEEQDLWVMRYSGSGHECAEAGEELERQGKAFGVAFYRGR